MTEDKGILIRNVYYMLAYAFQELRQNNYAEIDSENFDDIYDLFAEILSRGIAFQLKQGLYRTYIPKTESMQTIKGKVDINGTIANRVRNNRRIVCDFDDLSEDNIYNRILLASASILIKHSNVKKDKKANLKKLMLFFQNVQLIDVHTIRWNTLRFDRNNRNYRMLVYLCYFIINEWLLTTEEGNFKMREFSDDHMCRLFEKFVLEYYKKHHPEYKPLAAKIGWNIVEETSDTSILPDLQTDVLLSMGNRTMIIDTKYYTHTMQVHFNKQSVHSQNLYQIHTYVTEYDKNNTGKVDGMLLYAKTQDTIVPDGQMSMKSGNTIFFRTLDLNKPFDAIKAQLESFVQNTTS